MESSRKSRPEWDERKQIISLVTQFFGFAEAIQQPIVVRKKFFIKIEFSFFGAIARLRSQIFSRISLSFGDQFNIRISLSILKLFISMVLKSET